MPLPISAILPIFNCRERLARHLKSVATWAANVQEIIVVDSGSKDGSLEIARQVLTPFGAKFLHHPPGLYQSWNAGIAVATSPWCYISTVEDPVLPGGLTHLCEVATRLDADVVISPPEMRSADGTQPSSTSWPGVCLQNSLSSAGLNEIVLSKTESVAWMCGFPPSGLLGSSASNLYKTDFLQKNPFPTDYGMAGDTAWGIMISPLARITFTTKVCARFYCQTAWNDKSYRDQFVLKKKLDQLALETLRNDATENPKSAVMAGWLNYYGSHLAHYEEGIMKYEGGILNYLKRAVISEGLKAFALLRKSPPA